MRLIPQGAMPTAPTASVKLVDEYFAARPGGVPGLSTEHFAASALADANEPPLVTCPPLALRLVVMPSFGMNTMVRVEGVDGLPRLVAVRLIDGKATTVERTLGAAERHEARDVVGAADLGALPPDERVLGTDGVMSLFETFDGQRHVIRHRWCVRNKTAARCLTNLRALEERLLQLAGEDHPRR